jgi:hypothetical protein
MCALFIEKTESFKTKLIYAFYFYVDQLTQNPSNK